jgi:hypothetical protein
MTTIPIDSTTTILIDSTITIIIPTRPYSTRKPFPTPKPFPTAKAPPIANTTSNPTNLNKSKFKNSAINKIYPQPKPEKSSPIPIKNSHPQLKTLKTSIFSNLNPTINLFTQSLTKTHLCTPLSKPKKSSAKSGTSTTSSTKSNANSNQTNNKLS